MTHDWAKDDLIATQASYERPELGQANHHEIETESGLAAWLESGQGLGSLRIQGLDLRRYARDVGRRKDVQGLVVLGGVVPPELDRHLRQHGAVIFPGAPQAPVRPYRGTLYRPHELYAGLSEHGYARTPDALAYAWAKDSCLRHDAYASMLRAIHDDSMTDALTGLLADRKVVGVMGGHALARGTKGYAQAAHLGHRLARTDDLVVATGGGPGAMEAAGLGAWAADEASLAHGLEKLAQVPSFVPDIGAWAQVALEVRAQAGPAGERRAAEVRSIGIPTWFYGHEPPHVFADQIAKYFSNAVREDLLLSLSGAGLVVLPGAAGTVQEVFQIATRLYYEANDQVPPIVLVDEHHWTEHLPVWPLLQSLGRGRLMGERIFLVPDVHAAADVLAGCG